MQVPPLDLKSQYQTIKKEADSALAEVINSQHFVLGPTVEKLEAELAGYLKTKYAIAVASGSDALLIALMALKIGPGDEVITTPFTFFATGGAIARLGAKPVFVDIDPATYNISPAGIRSYLASNSKRVNPAHNLNSGKPKSQVMCGVKAIMPVHLYGQSCDMSEIMTIGKEYKIPVIEDAAQSLGSEYSVRPEIIPDIRRGRRDGVYPASAGPRLRKTGTLGLMGCYSFYPTKNL
ncbi:MAG: aminotransferase class I/II-fold pyridoxal phosphate-dependent enzyme, partial [Planctomycetota bacterium]